MARCMGKRTKALEHPPRVLSGASIVGNLEGGGPLTGRFDLVDTDPYFGQKSWEQAESELLRRCYTLACEKAGLQPDDPELVFSGDLLSQCCGSTFALRDTSVPFLGVYGACSTMAESLALAAMCVDAGFAETACAMTSSHFCTAERQFRMPLEYGAQRTPTAQWTVTGAGAVLLGQQDGGIHVTHATLGRIVDAGVTDTTHMGAAMAPAAYDTLRTHFSDTGRGPAGYDAVITGDLGQIGHEILADLLARDGLPMDKTFFSDCGILVYDAGTQDIHAGGSGCGCSASVLAGHILSNMREGLWNRVLFAATGALMSPQTSMQGETIPGICHAVALENF